MPLQDVSAFIVLAGGRIATICEGHVGREDPPIQCVKFLDLQVRMATLSQWTHDGTFARLIGRIDRVNT